MRPVVYHPKVPREARALLHHYESISPRLGDLFWDELLSAIDQIECTPGCIILIKRAYDEVTFGGSRCISSFGFCRIRYALS